MPATIPRVLQPPFSLVQLATTVQSDTIMGLPISVADVRTDLVAITLNNIPNGSMLVLGVTVNYRKTGADGPVNFRVSTDAPIAWAWPGNFQFPEYNHSLAILNDETEDRFTVIGIAEFGEGDSVLTLSGLSDLGAMDILSATAIAGFVFKA